MDEKEQNRIADAWHDLNASRYHQNSAVNKVCENLRLATPEKVENTARGFLHAQAQNIWMWPYSRSALNKIEVFARRNGWDATLSLVAHAPEKFGVLKGLDLAGSLTPARKRALEAAATAQRILREREGIVRQLLRHEPNLKRCLEEAARNSQELSLALTSILKEVEVRRQQEQEQVHERERQRSRGRGRSRGRNYDEGIDI